MELLLYSTHYARCKSIVIEKKEKDTLADVKLITCGREDGYQTHYTT